ncbi:hypothetical protein V2J09_000514 [Rumex salicifolius]
MPPCLGSAKSPLKPDQNVVSINVGGQIFQTTKQTLSCAGPNSMLSTISESSSSADQLFIDRDPESFTVLLSLLRTGNFPSSKVKSFDLEYIISEARFYGIESLLIDSLSNPSQFDAFGLLKSADLQLNGRDTPSSIATTPFGSLHVAHGSKLTSFDWSLRRKSTVLTQFTAIDSLLALSPSLAAAGATDFSGLQIIDLNAGVVRDHLNWENSTRSSSTVQAIGSSNEYLFTSYESGRRNSNVIIVYDVISDYRPVIEIARNEIYGAELDSAIPATKLTWLPSHSLLMASGSHSGPTGVTGNIKLWDIRSGKTTWELQEKEDCFADVTAMDSSSSMFKVGVNSGELFFLDFRSLGNKWVFLGNRRQVVVNGRKEGLGSKIECHGNRVFCSKGGDLELWSEVIVGSLKASEDGFLRGSVFRRSVLGRAKDRGGRRITNVAFGGNKMFVTRKDQQCVEVWQSSVRGL